MFYGFTLSREFSYTCPSCHNFCAHLHVKMVDITDSKVTIWSFCGHWVPTAYYCKMFVYDDLYGCFGQILFLRSQCIIKLSSYDYDSSEVPMWVVVDGHLVIIPGWPQVKFRSLRRNVCLSNSKLFCKEDQLWPCTMTQCKYCDKLFPLCQPLTTLFSKSPDCSDHRIYSSSKNVGVWRNMGASESGEYGSTSRRI